MVRTIISLSVSLLLGIGGTLGVQHFTANVHPTAVSCPDEASVSQEEHEAIDRAMRPLDTDYTPKGHFLKMPTLGENK